MAKFYHPSLIHLAVDEQAPQLQLQAMPSALRCRRSCISSQCLLKLGLVVLVVFACHLLLQGIQNGAVETSDTWWVHTDDLLMGQRAHRVFQKGGRFQKCEVPRLDPSDPPDDNVHCRRIKPLPNSCQLAHDLFSSEPPDKCEGEGPFNICQITTRDKHHHEVHCDSKVCEAGFSLGTIDPDLGILKWKEYGQSLDLENQIKSLISIHPQNHHDFCFIRCLPRKEEIEDNTDEQRAGTGSMEEQIYGDYVNQHYEFDLQDSLPKQLLILPRHFLKPKVKTRDKKSKISFNLYLLDSVSHSHFFRSLPKSVHKLRRIRKSGNASVFNFNLMQSLKGRTYENLQALFAGELYNPNNPFGVQDMPPKAVQMGTLLRSMKQAGYRTMWTEDLCWTWEWGIAKNMVVHSPSENQDVRWKKLKDVLQQAGIDGLSFSLASCEILKANGIRDTFHGPSVVCYNQKHHHHYTFEFLKKEQAQLNAAQQPFFHFTIANVAHEDSGRRVQTLDDDLADYFEFLSTQDNMVTVLLADHGNAYGAFMGKTIEARIEMFHPVFIILMSENVAKQLGPAKLKALSLNQDRLVSILDLHYMLQSLSPGGPVTIAPELAAYDLSPDGLLAPVLPNRTCDSIPRIDPNICICDNYEKAVANDSSRAEIAQAIVHEINEVILQNANAGTNRKGYGACKELELKWFGNVKESYPKTDETILKMDLHFESGRNSGNAEEVMFVVLQIKKTESSLHIQLLSFERMTSYSQFEKCKDAEVPTKLCVCDLPT
ncbi:uncharacterized protein LOC119728545 [Patiria miniata]|uniref:Uncharacterized protein n=1 Tax=Patiria miniata TaxID=46514 RepID=A0A913ZZ57_PATMI|nr:uncharacterized protein LOC119728545 [Patiria miniata]XP_038056755.1 uncharacterized protein LOC119728545 [Patiria miniata]